MSAPEVWERRLDRIRQVAARRCGFGEYPAELVASFEAINLPYQAWARIRPERKVEMFARYEAAKKSCP